MFCQKCGKELDENSEFCKYCGNKIGEGFQQEVVQKKVLVEETSKKYKKQLIYATLIGILGLLLAALDSQRFFDRGAIGFFAYIGLALLVAGIVWTIVVKFKIWWEHK